MPLLSSNFKTLKSDASGKGYVTRIMHLSPHRMVSYETLCASSTRGCREVCLYCSGRGFMPAVDAARRERTASMVMDPLRFFCKLIKELHAFEKSCRKVGMLPAVRLNGTSDIPWEGWELKGETLFSLFPNTVFYDYTKIATRMQSFLVERGRGRGWPSNYHLTFSASEDNEMLAMHILNAGGQVAVVFRRKPFPIIWRGFGVVDGEEDDLRFILPRRGRVVGLLAKGKARTSKTPFIHGEPDGK